MRIHCVGNLKQIALAAYLHTGDNSDWLPPHSLDYSNRKIWHHLLLDGNINLFQRAEERAWQCWIRGRDSSKFNFSYSWDDYELNDDAYYGSSFDDLRRKESCPIKPGSEVSPSDCVALGDMAGEERRVDSHYQSRVTSLAPPYVSPVALGDLLLILILFILFD